MQNAARRGVDAVKLDSWSLHFYRLPYRREVVWAYAAESSSDYALLKLVADDGTVGVAEGVVKPTRTGYSPRSLAVTLEDVIFPRLQGVELSDAAAVRKAFDWVEGNLGARALVDNACWAMRAAAAKQPLWKQWGGKQEVDLLWIVTRQKPAMMRPGGEPLPAFQLERAQAVAGAHVRRLGRHQRRLLPRHDPEQVDLLLAAPLLPQRLLRRRRAHRPAGVVDQGARAEVALDPVERLAHRRRVRQLDALQARKYDVLQRHRERARRVTGTRRLHHAFGHADRAVVCDQLQQRVVARAFRGVRPDDFAPVRQAIEMQRPGSSFTSTHAQRKTFCSRT